MSSVTVETGFIGVQDQQKSSESQIAAASTTPIIVSTVVVAVVLLIVIVLIVVYFSRKVRRMKDENFSVQYSPNGGIPGQTSLRSKSRYSETDVT